MLEALVRFHTILKIRADSGYEVDLVTLIAELFEVELDIVKKQEGQRGFAVQPRRWAVERSFGWYSRNRRLSKDYEHQCATSEAMVYIASIQVLLRRLRPNVDVEKPYVRWTTPSAA